jgi:predicted Zn-dependent protease
MMQIWTGLLLRVENEAQLAAVLGHEIAHYLERHTLEKLRDLKSRTALAQFMGMFGLVGAMAQVGTLAGGFAFSREHESRADALGMRLMQRAGYRGQEAATIWDNLIAELRVTGGEDAGRHNPMTATHPAAADRRDQLLRLAGEDTGQAGETTWRTLVTPYRRQWLMDELRRGQYEESLVLFERLQRQNGGADLLHARGEVYRMRQSHGDADRALALFREATGMPDAPIEAHRSLGLVHRSLNQIPAAQDAFKRYLELHPQAPDAELIKTYLEEKTP